MSPDQLKSIAYKAEMLEHAQNRVTRAEKAIEAAHAEKGSADLELNMRLKDYQDSCNSGVNFKPFDPHRQHSTPSFIR